METLRLTLEERSGDRWYEPRLAIDSLWPFGGGNSGVTTLDNTDAF